MKDSRLYLLKYYLRTSKNHFLENYPKKMLEQWLKIAIFTDFGQKNDGVPKKVLTSNLFQTLLVGETKKKTLMQIFQASLQKGYYKHSIWQR